MIVTDINKFTEDDLVPLSAIEHFVFCERQCALIHIEKIWDDNVYTAEGSQLHEKVHGSETESRGNLRISRALRIRSFRLGLSGVTDVVEFHRIQENPDDKNQDGFKFDGETGLWRPFIVEYKRGILRHVESFEVQLCAQALCLEEMLKTKVHAGAIFYGKTARRLDVTFADKLHEKTEFYAKKLHEFINANFTPKASYEKKCDKCSLINRCLPKTTGVKKDVRGYIQRSINNEEVDTL